SFDMDKTMVGGIAHEEDRRSDLRTCLSRRKLRLGQHACGSTRRREESRRSRKEAKVGTQRHKKNTKGTRISWRSGFCAFCVPAPELRINAFPPSFAVNLAI